MISTGTKADHYVTFFSTNTKTVTLYVFLIFIICAGCTDSDQFKNVKGKNYDKDSNTGIVTRYHDNGKPATIIKFINGKKHGLARSYYKNGKLKARINYKYGLKQGKAQLYYQDGNLFRTSFYFDNEINGVRKKYRTNGQILAEIPYSYGWPGTGLKEYNVSGSLKTDYPELIVRKIKDKKNNKTKGLKVYFGDGIDDATFFAGNLIDEQFLHNRLIELESSNGIGYVDLAEFPQNIIKNKITIIGKYNTRLKNPYIIQKELQIR